MRDYSKGKIYKIVCNETGNTYYGSTIQTISQRKAKHKNDYKRWKEGTQHYITAYKIIETGNWDIILLEKYPCKDIDELTARERFYIQNNECVNKVVPTRSNKEYYEDNKEKMNIWKKEYYQSNKEKIIEVSKQYREENKEKINKQRKQYRDLNKDKIKESSKKYYEKNKDKIIQYQKEYRKKSKKHLDLIEI